MRGGRTFSSASLRSCARRLSLAVPSALVLGDAADAATAATEELPERGAGSPLHVRYPGVSAEQFAEWRATFNARVEQGKHANLKTQAELDIIVDLLENWDDLSSKERRAVSGACVQWKKKYTVGGDGLLLKGNEICVPREELFDYLVPYHYQK